MSLRLVFMGTPDFAVPSLAALAGQGHDIAAVYTRAPRPAGRGQQERVSPVHALAQRLGLPVRTPSSLRGEAAADAFAAHDADAAIVVAYGHILPPAVLAAPRFGCLNLHASLLPRWRGAAPLQRAVMAGDAETGVMVMRMEEGLDTGPVAMAERTPITATTTAGDTHDRLAPLGADLLVRAVAALERGSLGFVPQAEEGVTYARKVNKAETRIDWALPAETVRAHINGLSPFPGAWFEADLGRGMERVKALRAAPAEGGGTPGMLRDGALTIACGSGAVRLMHLQRAGGSAMTADDFLRGAALKAGTILT